MGVGSPVIGASVGSSRRTASLLVAPALVLVAVVQVAPALYSLYGSLRDIRFFADRGFIGLAHFEELILDPDTHEALVRSLVFTASSLVVAMTLALSIALLVRRMGSRGTLLATLVLVPWAMSPIAVAIIWKWILAPFGGGLLATLLASFGWDPVSLLSEPVSSMAVLVATSVWRNFAFAALVLTAGLSQIPDELYRASAVDGAGPFQRFRQGDPPAGHAIDPDRGRRAYDQLFQRGPDDHRPDRGRTRDGDHDALL